jgi:hypothetical protein
MKRQPCPDAFSELSSHTFLLSSHPSGIQYFQSIITSKSLKQTLSTSTLKFSSLAKRRSTQPPGIVLNTESELEASRLLLLRVLLTLSSSSRHAPSSWMSHLPTILLYTLRMCVEYVVGLLRSSPEGAASNPDREGRDEKGLMR